MADTKISDLTAVTDVVATDEYVLARSGATRKIDADDLLVADNVSFTPTGTIASTDVQAAIAEVAAEAGVGGGSGARAYALQLTTPRVTSLSGNSFWSTIALTDWDAGHWEFVKDVDGKLYGQVIVPPSYVSGGVIRLAIAANATSGVTRLGVGTKAVADTESLNPGALTDETKQDITVPGTAYLRKDVTFTLTETLAASDLLVVEIFHEGSHGNDTLAVNTLLMGAWLTLTA